MRNSSGILGSLPSLRCPYSRGLDDSCMTCLSASWAGHTAPDCPCTSHSPCTEPASMLDVLDRKAGDMVAPGPCCVLQSDVCTRIQVCTPNHCRWIEWLSLLNQFKKYTGLQQDGCSFSAVYTCNWLRTVVVASCKGSESSCQRSSSAPLPMFPAAMR